MHPLPSTPLVSIILATYNGETYLKEQLDSIFAQTYPHIELICVDDGSKDRTVEILHEYAATRTNMKVYQNEKNLGFIGNFDKGCSLSSGDLLAMCDQDDYWYPEKIARKVSELGDHALIFCNSRLCDAELAPMGGLISDRVVFKSFYDPMELSVLCRMYGHAIVFRRTLFDTAHPFLEVIPPDWWLPYLATYQGGVKYLPEVLVDYRQHASNVYGVIGSKRKKKKQTESRRARTARDVTRTRYRMQRFYEACPADKVREKALLKKLLRSYESFSLINDFRRMFFFFAHYETLLAVKPYNVWRKWFFCLKMFVKVK